MSTSITFQVSNRATKAGERLPYRAHPFPASQQCGHKSIFIHGPQGSGKTRNAEALCKHFQLRGVLEEWVPGDTVPMTGYLILTHHETALHSRRVLHIEQALDMLHRSPAGYPF